MTKMTTQDLARAILDVEDLNAWLGGDATTLSLAIFEASRAGDEDAEWMQRCILDNDAQSLRLAARTIAAA